MSARQVAHNRGEASRSPTACQYEQPPLLWGVFPLLVIWSLACTPDIPEPRLYVASTVPEQGAVHPADAPLRIRFEGYLHPATRWGGAVTVESGEMGHGVSVGYDPVDQSLVVTPTVPFRPGLAYTLTVPEERVIGAVGAVFEEAFTLDFVAGPPTALPAPEATVFADHVAPIFVAQCGCHGPTGETAPVLTPSALLGEASWRQPNWPLVNPGRPMSSYLVLRMLPDYPGITGPTKVLEDDEVRVVIDWIRHLPGG